MLPEIAITLGATAFQAWLDSKNLPRESEYVYDPETLARLKRMHAQSVNMATESTASLAGQAGAQRAAASGLSGGSFVSSVNQAEAPAYAEGARQNAQFASDLEMQNALGRMQYGQAWREGINNLRSNVGSNVASGAQSILAMGQYDNLNSQYGQQTPKSSLPPPREETAQSQLPMGARGWTPVAGHGKGEIFGNRVVNPRTGEFLYQKTNRIPNMATGGYGEVNSWADPINNLSYGEWRSPWRSPHVRGGR